MTNSTIIYFLLGEYKKNKEENKIYNDITTKHKKKKKNNYVIPVWMYNLHNLLE